MEIKNENTAHVRVAVDLKLGLFVFIYASIGPLLLGRNPRKCDVPVLFPAMEPTIFSEGISRVALRVSQDRRSLTRFSQNPIVLSNRTRRHELAPNVETEIEWANDLAFVGPRKDLIWKISSPPHGMLLEEHGCRVSHLLLVRGVNVAELLSPGMLLLEVRESHSPSRLSELFDTGELPEKLRQVIFHHLVE